MNDTTTPLGCGPEGTVSQYAELLNTLESMAGSYTTPRHRDALREAGRTIMRLEKCFSEATRERDEARAKLEWSPDHPYDGIECRNATIKCLDEIVDRQRAELRAREAYAEQHKAALRQIMVAADFPNRPGDDMLPDLMGRLETIYLAAKSALEGGVEPTLDTPAPVLEVGCVPPTAGGGNLNTRADAQIHSPLNACQHRDYCRSMESRLGLWEGAASSSSPTFATWRALETMEEQRRDGAVEVSFGHQFAPAGNSTSTSERAHAVPDTPLTNRVMRPGDGDRMDLATLSRTMERLLRRIVVGWRESGTAEVWDSVALNEAAALMDGAAVKPSQGNTEDKHGA